MKKNCWDSLSKISIGNGQQISISNRQQKVYDSALCKVLTVFSFYSTKKKLFLNL